jgi:glutaredoxin
MVGIFSRVREFLKQPARAKPLPVVVLYTRQKCHLCEEAKDLLNKLQSEEPFNLEVFDVDADPALRAQFNEDVPVVYIHGRRAFKHRIDGGKFLKSLRAGGNKLI